MLGDLPFLNEGTENYSDESILFMYTDGVTEMENNDGQHFGIEFITTFIQQNMKIDSMKHLNQKMVEEFKNYKQDADFNDDVTFLTARL